MSIQRSRPINKGKVIAGSGSILANIDAKTRKSFAQHANTAIDHKVEHDKEVAYEKEKLHKLALQKKAVKMKRRHHSLLYWLLKASYREIWQHFFQSKK